MQVFTDQECRDIVQEFDAAEQKRDENNEAYYFNSVGVGNLPTTLKYVDRITAELSKRYPGIQFSNTYTRQYNKGSVLKLHTDRVGLDLTLSVCLEKRTPIAWPLNVSRKVWQGDWRIDANESKFKQEYDSYDPSEGIGAVCEGRKYPHWREEFKCRDGERAVYVFYHWTFPKKVYRPSIKMECPKIEVYDNFLTKTECQLLINTAASKLQRSMVVDNSTGGSMLNENRTSYGMSFKVGENLVVEEIERRIAELIGVPVAHGEGLQILRYAIGQEYKPHYDYFDPNSSALEEQIKNNRIKTVLMYLNTPEEGGATIFPDAGVSIEAKQGSALVFSYPEPIPGSKTLHGGSPVIAGEKWVATKWIRRLEY